jgi:hypothetical protein
MGDGPRGLARLIAKPAGNPVPFEQRPALVCHTLRDGALVPSNIRDCVGPDCGVQLFVLAGRTTERVDNRELRPLCLQCHIRGGGGLLMLHPEERAELDAIGATEQVMSMLAAMNTTITTVHRQVPS